MNVALQGSILAIGVASFAMVACNHHDDRAVAKHPAQPHTSTELTPEQRRAEERHAEERRAEERRAEERRAEDRLAEERRLEERRAEERRAEEKRAEERAHNQNASRPYGGGPAEPAKTTTTSSAVGRISAARCDREVRCHNVGTKEKYVTRGECMSRMQSDKRDDINARECPGGVSEKELDNCLEAVRTEDCGNPLDAISRLNACRAGNLCLK